MKAAAASSLRVVWWSLPRSRSAAADGRGVVEAQHALLEPGFNDVIERSTAFAGEAFDALDAGDQVASRRVGQRGGELGERRAVVALDDAGVVDEQARGGVDRQGLDRVEAGRGDAQRVAVVALLELVAKVFELLQVALDGSLADAGVAGEFGHGARCPLELLDQRHQPGRLGRSPGGYGCVHGTPDRVGVRGRCGEAVAGSGRTGAPDAPRRRR